MEGYDKKGKLTMKSNNVPIELAVITSNRDSPHGYASSGNAPGTSLTSNPRIVEVVTENANSATTNTTNDARAHFLPIVGYANEPLLPLSKACVPLANIIHNLSFYVQKALEETPKRPPDGLTTDESAAIRLYTLEWDEQYQSLRSMLNGTLQNSDRKLLRPYFKYMKLFLTALVKLPCVPPLTIWRGVTKDLSTELLPGTSVTWWAFSSCTTEMTVFENDMYLGNTVNRTLFSVEAINGRSIRAHSHFAKDEEILLLPGTHMIVQSQFNHKAYLHIIHLKEVISEEILLEPPFKGASIYPRVDLHWYRKKRFILPIILLLAVLIIAAIVGSVVGTRPKTNAVLPVCGNPYTIATRYPTGKSPYSVIQGYFRDNTKLDLIVANSKDDTVSVLLGNADGTFQTQINYPTGYHPNSVISGDFNNDKKLDMAVANFYDNTISVLLGNGNGMFQTQIKYTTGSSPQSLISGDFNNDKQLDLAVANFQDNTVSVLLAHGGGTYQTQIKYVTGSGPISLVAGDFNNDNKLDLAVANSNSNTISVLSGNEDGTFQNQIIYWTGNNPQSVISGDFNNDKKLDLAVANSNSNTVTVLFGMGDGTFKPPMNYTVGLYPSSVISGDFNNDKKLDLAVANYQDNTISVLLAHGGGTYQTQIKYVTGSGPISLVAGDFNNDNKLDLVVANQGSNDLSVFLNICS